MLGLLGNTKLDNSESYADQICDIKPAELPSRSIESVQQSLMLPPVRRRSSASVHAILQKSSSINPALNSSTSASKVISSDAIKAAVQVDCKKAKIDSEVITLTRSLPVRFVTYGVSAVILLAVAFVVFQFAGLLELRYQCDAKQAQLATLEHQQDELRAELAQSVSLASLEVQAKALGMVYPKESKKLDCRAASGKGKLASLNMQVR